MKRKVVAVTGGIGSGKSQVCAILREMGFTTIDCDDLARQLANDKAVIAAVERLLGSDCILDGAINRAKVREIVFKDADLLKKYDEIFFERVRQRLIELIERIDGSVFVEIAVIDAFEFPFDEIWLIESEPNVQIERVKARDGVTEQNVRNIMSKQRFNAAFTRILPNNGSIDELKNQVVSALKDAQIV